VQESAAPSQEDSTAPAKKNRRRKKKSGSGAGEAQPEQVEMQAPEENRWEWESAFSRERTLNRGVRQGKLEDTLPSDPAMPAADFYKPNPLDSDVIMDATARLLAPRRGSLRTPQRRSDPGKKQAPAGKESRPEEKARPEKSGKEPQSKQGKKSR